MNLPDGHFYLSNSKMTAILFVLHGGENKLEEKTLVGKNIQSILYNLHFRFRNFLELKTVCLFSPPSSPLSSLGNYNLDVMG